MSRQPKQDGTPKRDSIWRRSLATLRSALSWMSSWPTRRREKRLLVVKQALAMVLVERVPQLEARLLEALEPPMLLMAKQQPELPLQVADRLQLVLAPMQVQHLDCLQELKELLLELLQSTQPDPSAEISRLAGTLSRRPSFPSSES